MAKRKTEAATEDVPITQYLQQIANCLAFLVVNADALKDKTKTDLIETLTKFGFDRNAIASILQTSPETVSVRQLELKAASKATKAPKS